MKVLFISTVAFDKNGITTFIVNNALELSEDYSVDVAASMNIDKNSKDELVSHHIRLIELPSRKKHLLKYISKLTSIIKKEKYDIVHVNGNSSTMVFELLAAALAGCQHRIAHSHNTKTDHPILNKLLFPFFNKLVTGRIACNDEAGKWLFKGKKFVIINNGIKISDYYPDSSSREYIRKNLKTGNSTIIIGNIGIFNYQKNHEFMIKVIKQLDLKYKLVLVGDGPDIAKIKGLVKKEGVVDRVFFTGKVDHPEQYLSAFDIFIMPSRFEGLPFALVEAQASGLSCLASNNVDASSNLTGNVTYLTIDNPQIWVKYISNSEFNSFDKRVSNFEFYKEKIIANGYDLKTNTEKLVNYYLNLIKPKN